MSIDFLIPTIYPIVLMLLLWFICFRAIYTVKRINESLDAIYLYSAFHNNQGLFIRELCNNMSIGFIRYFLSFNLWGKFSAIKPMYKKEVVQNWTEFYNKYNYK